TVLEQFVGRLRLDAEFLGPLLGGSRQDIGNGAHFEPLEQGREAQIGARDIAGTHDADAKGLGHLSYFHFLAAAMERVAKRTASEGLSCSATKYWALVLLWTLPIRLSQSSTPSPTSAQPSSSAFWPAGAMSLT